MMTEALGGMFFGVVVAPVTEEYSESCFHIGFVASQTFEPGDISRPPRLPVQVMYLKLRQVRFTAALTLTAEPDEHVGTHLRDLFITQMPAVLTGHNQVLKRNLIYW